jgi:type I restriction enzyme S subunit
MEVREADMAYSNLATPTTDDVPAGYKQTEVGVIPEDWDTLALWEITTLQRGYDLPHRLRKPGSVPIVTSSGLESMHSEAKVKAPGVVTGRYGTIGEVFLIQEDFWPLNTTLYVSNFHGNDPAFISYFLRTLDFHKHSGKSGVPGINRNDIHEVVVSVPHAKAEQEAIAEVLSDADALIESLEHLLAKKRQIKQGAMQQLLTGKQRLPGFTGKWQEKALQEVANCLDNLRVPLNERQREKMEGDYPYCGANGVLDFVDRYVVDDDIILMAKAASRQWRSAPCRALRMSGNGLGVRSSG